MACRSLDGVSAPAGFGDRLASGAHLGGLAGAVAARRGFGGRAVGQAGNVARCEGLAWSLFSQLIRANCLAQRSLTALSKLAALAFWRAVRSSSSVGGKLTLASSYWDLSSVRDRHSSGRIESRQVAGPICQSDSRSCRFGQFSGVNNFFSASSKAAAIQRRSSSSAWHAFNREPEVSAVTQVVAVASSSISGRVFRVTARNVAVSSAAGHLAIQASG